MTTLTVSLTPYGPPVSVTVHPAVVLGRAFERAWRDPSDRQRAALRDAIVRLARQLRADALSPEASVIAFKRAIFHFGGVHELPSLALERHRDGDECAAAYAEAFTMFVDGYFGPAAESEE